jgi:hypothetical protein
LIGTLSRRPDKRSPTLTLACYTVHVVAPASLTPPLGVRDDDVQLTWWLSCHVQANANKPGPFPPKREDPTRGQLPPEMGMHRSTWRASSWAAQPSARQPKGKKLSGDEGRDESKSYSPATWQKTTVSNRKWPSAMASQWTTTESRSIGDPSLGITRKAMPHLPQHNEGGYNDWAGEPESSRRGGGATGRTGRSQSSLSGGNGTQSPTWLLINQVREKHVFREHQPYEFLRSRTSMKGGGVA